MTPHVYRSLFIIAMTVLRAGSASAPYTPLSTAYLLQDRLAWHSRGKQHCLKKAPKKRRVWLSASVLYGTKHVVCAQSQRLWISRHRFSEIVPFNNIFQVEALQPSADCTRTGSTRSDCQYVYLAGMSVLLLTAQTVCFVSVSACLYLCPYVCLYICMNVCMRVCVSIHPKLHEFIIRWCPMHI